MFTVAQIKEAHSKVKSGVEFPEYIQNIKKFGVIGFETRVIDGATQYFGANDFYVSSEPEYIPLTISNYSNVIEFRNYLKIHQQGKTDFITFCEHCAITGIDRWFVDLEIMTCTYFDKVGNKILVEKIPS